MNENLQRNKKRLREYNITLRKEKNTDFFPFVGQEKVEHSRRIMGA